MRGRERKRESIPREHDVEFSRGYAVFYCQHVLTLRTNILLLSNFYQDYLYKYKLQSAAIQSKRNNATINRVIEDENETRYGNFSIVVSMRLRVESRCNFREWHVRTVPKFAIIHRRFVKEPRRTLIDAHISPVVGDRAKLPKVRHTLIKVHRSRRHGAN